MPETIGVESDVPESVMYVPPGVRITWLRLPPPQASNRPAPGR